MLRHLVRLLGLALALCAGACSLPMELPKDFLVLDRFDEDEDFRAVTGDDARVWIRQFEDDNEGSLDFWAEAVEYDFVQQRGYELLGKGDVKNRSDVGGKWFECAANVHGERYGYLVAVWVKPKLLKRGCIVKVVEFTARQEVFGKRVEAVRAGLRSVRG